MIMKLLLKISTLAACLLAATVAADVQQKLYVLSSLGNDVSVIDVASNRLIGAIEVGDRPHGIAATRAQDKLFVAVEHDNTLAVIDPVTDTVTKKYTVFGNRPNEIDVTSDGRFVYLPILGDGVYEVFDMEEEAIIARIPTNGFPHNVVISPDDKYAYLSPMDRGNTPVETISAAGFPTTLNNKIYVVDAQRHELVGTITTDDAPRPIAISPDGKWLYANVDGLQGFVVLDLEKREQVARVEYELSADERARPSRSHGIIASPDGKELWTSDVNLGLVFVFDVTQHPPVQVARIENDGPVYWMTMTPDGKTLYAASAESDTVTVFDVASRTRTTSIQLPAGKSPKRLLVLSVDDGG